MTGAIQFYTDIPKDLYRLGCGRTASWKESALLATSIALRAISIYGVVVTGLRFAAQTTIPNGILYLATIFSGVEMSIVGLNQADQVDKHYSQWIEYQPLTITKTSDYIKGTFLLERLYQRLLGVK